MAVRIGTSEHGGTFYTQGLAFVELFNRSKSGEPGVVQTSDASIHNAEQLDRGELEFGFMASNWIGRAKNATPPFTKPIALRMVAPANAGPMCFVKLAGSPIESVADFKGKRIAIGAKGSGMEQHIHTIFDVLGISFDSFTSVHMGFTEGAEALVAGAIDVQFHPPIPNKVLTDLSRRADIRVIPFGPGQLDKVLAHVPFYRPVVMEKDVFRGVVADVTQIGVINVLVTHETNPRAGCLCHGEDNHRQPRQPAADEPAIQRTEESFRTTARQGRRGLRVRRCGFTSGAVRAYREAGWLK